MSTLSPKITLNWNNQVNISSDQKQIQSLVTNVEIKCLTDSAYSVQLPYPSGTRFPSAAFEGDYCAFILSAPDTTIPILALVSGEDDAYTIVEGTEGWFFEDNAYWYLGQGGIMIVGTIDIG